MFTIKAKILKPQIGCLDALHEYVRAVRSIRKFAVYGGYSGYYVRARYSRQPYRVYFRQGIYACRFVRNDCDDWPHSPQTNVSKHASTPMRTTRFSAEKPGADAKIRILRRQTRTRFRRFSSFPRSIHRHGMARES